LKVLSVTLENTSIGKDLVFNVTFVNQGQSPIYFTDPGVQIVSISCLYIPPPSTTTVTIGVQQATTITMANATMGCAGSSPSFPVATYAITQTNPNVGCATDRIIYMESVAAGAARSVYWSACPFYGTHYRIVAKGSFEVILGITWSPTQYPSNNVYETVVIQGFMVG
jgi:hypothetical protein